MHRFVLLRHIGSPASSLVSHWDLMLECDGALATWRLDWLPQSWVAAFGVHDSTPSPLAAGESAHAVQLAPHRLAYLDYEGPLSGDRGSVSRWDDGRYDATHRNDDAWAFTLSGRILRVQVQLKRRAGACWELETSP